MSFLGNNSLPSNFTKHKLEEQRRALRAGSVKRGISGIPWVPPLVLLLSGRRRRPDFFKVFFGQISKANGPKSGIWTILGFSPVLLLSTTGGTQGIPLILYSILVFSFVFGSSQKTHFIWLLGKIYTGPQIPDKILP